MFALLIITRIILSSVFLSAGLSKLADPAGSRKSLEDFGLPEVLAAPAAVILPLVELTLAVALLLSRYAWYGAWGAITLLAIFILAISVTLALGRKPECRCFGQLHSKPIGPELIARSVGLALLPGLILYSGPSQPGIAAWISQATAAQQLWFVLAMAAAAVFAIHCWLTFQLVQQGGRVLLRLDDLEKRLSSPPGSVPTVPAPTQAQAPPAGLPLGTKAPAFALPDLDGSTATQSGEDQGPSVRPFPASGQAGNIRGIPDSTHTHCPCGRS
jgi:uncharacterized membrane protein YphA (DoxX/SURF4 family)